ncbi:MAG TPA: TlpA disulfide reductase family protein [Kofleriaceae bacterium]|nr:TlpA disulfide reductase family protein [Kofleriaceae bacterium]
MTLVGRLGLAIAQPRAALALAGDRRHAGRAGSDLLAAIVILVIATQLRALVEAAWVGWAVDAGIGARLLVHVLARTLTVDLGFLVIGAAVIWAGSGPRRELGRAFDLACVAALPLVLVDLALGVVARATGLVPPIELMWAIIAVQYAWTGALLALAIAELRRASGAVPGPGRAAGLAVIAVAGLGLALQVTWLSRHGDLVRPMTSGSRAPAFALPAVGPHGALGPRVAIAPGKITVLDFWATWCGPCLQALPRLDAFTRRHPDVAVIAVNVDDAGKARALFDARGYAMTLVADDGDTSERYGVMSYPHTVVIDRQEMVARVGGSALDLEAAVAGLQ